MEVIVRSYVPDVTTFQMQGMNLQVLLLLQVPPDELNRLQVPHDIPNFDKLPLKTRRALEAIFER